MSRTADDGRDAAHRDSNSESESDDDGYGGRYGGVNCPYCGEEVGILRYHFPCSADGTDTEGEQ